jgi:subtilisin family serine protease/subtilisin-like proprotein convertase family protein
MNKPSAIKAGSRRRFSIGASMRSLVLLLIIVVGSSAALAQQTILFDGHEADPGRLLAKMRTATKAKSAKHYEDLATRAAAASPEVGKANAYSHVPGLVFLQLAQPLAPVAPPVARGSQQAAPLERTGELKALIEKLMATGLYEYVEPDYILRINNVPTDAAYNNGTLWGLRNTGQRGGVAGADIRAEQAWATTVGSPDVIVAVIDSGIDYNHPDLRANMWRNPGETFNGRDDDGNGFIDDVYGINAINMTGDPMDDNNHGTHCAGTIAAQANAGGPHVGVAWNAQLMALKFLSAGGSGRTSDAITCVNYATAKGAHISNNSWGGGGYSQGLFDAIRANRDAGSLFVAAAGNNYNNNDSFPSYPAGYQIDNIIAVAAMDRRDTKTDFSNYGVRSVHIGAPGQDIYSCLAGGGYAEYAGTSMAAPHVAGVAALVWSAFPEWQSLDPRNMTAIRNRILGTARPVPAMSGLVATGGMVDAAAAVQAGDAPVTIVASLSTRPSPLPAGVQGDAFITLTRQGAPLPGATVTAVIQGQSFTFADDGQLPDASANDGIYSTVVGPYTPGSYAVDTTIVFEGQAYPRNLSLFVEEAGPANDDFEDATPTGNDARFTASSVRATAQEGEPGWRSGGSGTPRKTLWWAWSPGVSGPATITTFDSNFDTTLAVFTGSALQSLTWIVGNDDAESGGLQSSVTFEAAVGVTYYIQVDGWNGASGNVVLNVPPGGVVEAPPVFVRNPVSQTVPQGATAIFTAEARGNPGPVYQWYFNEDPLADDPGRIEGATTSELTIRDVLGADSGVYHCRATNAQGFADSSLATLVVETGVRPANDDLAAAQPLVPGEAVTGSSNLATREPGEPEHANLFGDKSVWYTWTSTEEGTVTLDTSGSSYDTTLAVYIGDTVENLRLVASNDDNGGSVQSYVQFSTKANVTYRIAVDGNGAGVSGFINLLLQFAGGGGEVVVPSPDTPLPISDLTTVESYIQISGQPLTMPAESILLDLNITHSYRGDLVVTLIGPQGEVFTISNRQGRGARDIIISAAPLGSFGNTAPGAISPNGRWTLRLQDAAPGDEGTLNGWALRFPGGTPDDDDEEFFPPDVGQPIQDLIPTVVTLEVSGVPADLPLGNIRLNLAIRHTWRGDLRVELVAPGDRSAPAFVISDREGGSQHDVVINNQPLDSPAFRVVPQNVQNINPNGTWTLVITDTVRGDTGVLESWSLVVSPAPRNPGEDTTPPVIELIGANPLEVALGVALTDPGARVTDNIDAERVITGVGEVNTSVPGNYTLTYTAQDAAGNQADPVTRTVIVRPDTVPPVITLIGDNPLEIEPGVAFIDPGARVTDNVDAERVITGTGAVNTSVPGTYTLTYTAQDAAGNQADPVTRTVIVRPDTVAPVISLLGANPLKVPLGSDFTDPGARVTDNLDPESVITGTGSVDTALPGTYLLTYTAQDAAGNEATPVTRRVIVEALPPGSFAGVFEPVGEGTTDLESYRSAAGAVTFRVTPGGKVTGQLFHRDAVRRVRGFINRSSGSGYLYALARGEDQPTVLLPVAVRALEGGGVFFVADLKELVPGATVNCHAIDRTDQGRQRVNAWLQEDGNNVDESGAPRGHGYATARTLRSGAVAVAGRLPDARRFAGSSRLVNQGSGREFVLLHALRPKPGQFLLGGNLLGVDVADDGSVAGIGIDGTTERLAWSNGEELIRLSVDGTKWSPSPGQPLFEGTFEARLRLDDGAVAEFSADWPANGQPVFVTEDESAEPLRFSVNRRTGVFRGSVRPDPQTGRRSFRGILLDPAPVHLDGALLQGAGYLSGPDGSASPVEITRP